MLRHYQLRAIELLEQSMAAGHLRPAIQLPTGGGKTVIATTLARCVVEKGGRVTFVVPRLTLITQTIAAFEREGLDHLGVIQAKHPRKDPAAPIQIASLQTLVRRGIPPADLVIIDECHIQFDSLKAWMANPEWAHIPFIGLSATPWARKMADHWDDLLCPTSILELIDRGFLCRFVVFAPSKPDLSQVRTVTTPHGLDYKEDELAVACDQTELVGNIVDTWFLRAAGLPTIAYGVNQDHAKHIMTRFLEAGVAAEYIDCFTSLRDRDQVFDRLRSGETTIICNVSVADTGVDLPMVGCIIDARPTQSEIRYVQTIGRGLRPFEDKPRLIILDHGGNTQRLGFVTHIGHAELLGNIPPPKKNFGGQSWPEVKLCPECKAAVPPATRICPECGFEIIPPKPVVEVGGDLVEEDVEAAMEAARVEVRFYSMFKTYADQRGYKPGWAGYKFKEKPLAKWRRQSGRQGDRAGR